MGFFGKKTTVKIPCEVHGSHDMPMHAVAISAEEMPDGLRKILEGMAPDRIRPRGMDTRPAVPTPPDVPSNRPVYSELDRMVIRTKEADFATEAKVMLDSVTEEYKSRILPKDHGKVEVAVRAGFDLINKLLIDNEHDGMSPMHEAMLADFGDKVLSSFKLKARRG